MNYFKLNSQNLSRIPSYIKTPGYKRKKIKAGIIHIGVGGFHRAHQAYYTDQLLHDECINDWGICGVGLLEFDQKIINTLKEQDGLYTLIIKGLDGTLDKTVVGSIVEYLFAPENPMVVIEKMADPDIKIITLTITEGGYNYNEASDEFDSNNPKIQHDLKYKKSPKTIFGYLNHALKLRKDRGLKGLTIQSCDNIQGNGHLTKRMLLSYVKLAEPSLLDWVESNVSFPNSMVDRITPVTTPSDISELKESDGIEDRWPVVCEPFIQWVIEDDFIAGRPPWEQVGAQFVKDVIPFEKMKLSLLNAGHTILGVLGALIGYSTIDEAVNDSDIRTFLQNYMDDEASPVLGQIEGVNLQTYKRSLMERFGNIYIKDQIERICSESSAKIPIFILPTITKQLKGQSNVKHAAFIIAAWAIYSLCFDENGKELNRDDVQKYVLNKLAKKAVDNPTSFLENEAIFGNLKESKVFVNSYTSAYNNIKENGIRKCIINMNN